MGCLVTFRLQRLLTLYSDSFVCHYRGTVEVKGKGLMETWFVEAERDASCVT